MLNDNEIQRLAAMGSALRPDWPARSLATFLSKHFAGRAYGDVAVALAWVATRTKTETPRLLLEAGPWWKACQVDGTTAPRNYRVPCSEHPGETLPCGRCANEAVPARAIAEHHIANARSALRLAAATLCGHGVDRQRVKCAECERPAPKPAASAAANDQRDQTETEEATNA